MWYIAPYSKGVRNRYRSARLLAFIGPWRFLLPLRMSTMTRCVLLKADDECSNGHHRKVHHDV
jgi:hypothetical protein